MSDQRGRDLGPNDPLHYAQRRLREASRSSDVALSGPAKDNVGWSVGRMPDENIGHLGPVEGLDSSLRKQPDLFAEAVARAMQEQYEPEFVAASSILEHRQSFGVAARFAAAASVAALVALVFVIANPTSQDPGDKTSTALPSWQSPASFSYPAPQRKPASTLVVRDSSGPVNEPLSLGVSVTSPGPGTTVIIDRIPATATLTVGRRINSNEWRVPAQEVSDASVIPPTDFVGAMKLAVELRSADGAAPVGSSVQLTWTSAMPGSMVSVSAHAAATEPFGVVEPTPERQTPTAVLTPSGAAASVPQARAEPPKREVSPQEIAHVVGRAQELMANRDLRAARLLLLRAAEAHDAHAALLLAKTFDPIVLKQIGATGVEPNVAQARNWYQKAEEWGAPDVQRQLNALASYTR